MSHINTVHRSIRKHLFIMSFQDNNNSIVGIRPILNRKERGMMVTTIILLTNIVLYPQKNYEK